MNIKKWFVPLGFSREDVKDQEEFEKEDFEDSLDQLKYQTFGQIIDVKKESKKFDYKFNELDYIITILGILSLPILISTLPFLRLLN
jgi:hypothetical protein